MNVKTRFPPSPTGYLHIGSLRTALYNYLFAKKHNGSFIVRVEDTDRERYVEGAVESLIHTLEQVNISYDEGPILQNGVLSEKGAHGPYTQSSRLDIYKKYVNQLVEQGSAYYCFCTKDRLQDLRKQQELAKLSTKYDRTCYHLSNEEVEKRLNENQPHVVRLLIPEGETTFIDEIRGTITINNNEIDDQVLLKTDGYPTYHMAVVVDDHLMGVTHVIRGEEWISSVPKHIILYNALRFPLPSFAHLPLILNQDKSKLSKRQGDVAVEDFLKKGYLPEALVNFVALLGFNPSGDQEIYTMKELINSFDLSRVNKGGAVFDVTKLDWMNSEYIKNTEIEDLLELAKPFWGDASFSEEQKKKIIQVEQSRLKRLEELSNHLAVYESVQSFDKEELIWKKSTEEETFMHLNALIALIEKEAEETFTHLDQIETFIKAYIQEGDYQNGNVLWPLRVALSGQQRSPSPFELLWVLGKKEGLARIKSAVQTS